MKTVTLLSLVLLIGAAPMRASEPIKIIHESFSSVSDGPPLDQMPGWEHHYGDGSVPRVLTAAGYEGNGVRFSSEASYRLALESPAGVGRKYHAWELRFKLRVMAENDSYIMSQIVLGQSGGVNGLSVRFNGGTKDGWEDNFVEVSTGGESWGKMQFGEVSDSPWRKGQWYEVVVSGIRLDGQRNGELVGKISINQLDTKNEDTKTLIQDVPVACVGAGAFNQADVIIIGNAGSARTFDVDDIILKAGAL
ncbi:MAG: hypothetical protein ABII82_13480 [Verrucomicrobiota bacterium]